MANRSQSPGPTCRLFVIGDHIDTPARQLSLLHLNETYHSRHIQVDDGAGGILFLFAGPGIIAIHYPAFLLNQMVYFPFSLPGRSRNPVSLPEERVEIQDRDAKITPGLLVSEDYPGPSFPCASTLSIGFHLRVTYLLRERTISIGSPHILSSLLSVVRKPAFINNSST